MTLVYCIVTHFTTGDDDNGTHQKCVHVNMLHMMIMIIIGH